MIPTTRPARGWNCTKCQRLDRNGRYIKLSQKRICSLNVNSDLHWKIGVCTATQLQILTSSPSHPIIEDFQRFQMVPAKNLFGSMCQSLDVMILFTRPLPGHHFTPWRCWGSDQLYCSQQKSQTNYIYINEI